MVTHATSHEITQESSASFHGSLNLDSGISSPIGVDVINIDNNHTAMIVTPRSLDKIINAEGTQELYDKEELIDDGNNKAAPDLIVDLKTVQNIVNEHLGPCKVCNLEQQELVQGYTVSFGFDPPLNKD